MNIKELREMTGQTLMDSSGTKIRVGESFDGINEKKWAVNHFFFCTPSIPLA